MLRRGPAAWYGQPRIFDPRLQREAMRHITPRDDARRHAVPALAVSHPQPERAWIPG